ncbi:MAG: hypothetical protein KGI45_02075 [Patescibacteria group bacterium]|nr:hypothetical protein [Patescibacteria group bacterium]
MKAKESRSAEGTAAAIGTVVISKVLRFLIHMRPHLDEILGRLLVVLYGKRQFVDAEHAQVLFVEGDPAGNDATFDRDGDIPIGISNSRFNEHVGPEGRMEEECASTLVAKFLHVEENEELTDLLASTLFYDTHGECPNTHIAEMIKAATRVDPDSSLKIMNRATTMLEAMIVRKKYGIAAISGEMTLAEIFKAWKDKQSDEIAANPDAFAHLERSIEKSMARSEEVCELSYIVTSLFRRQFYTDDQILDMIFETLDDMWYDQRRFWAKLEEIREEDRFIPIQALLKSGFGGDEKEATLKLYACYDDDMLTQKAARFAGADIVVQVSSSYNVQIFTKSRPGLSLANPVKMIRWMELPFELRDKVSWQELSMPGTIRGVEHWYYFRKGQMFFNGSLTKKARPALGPGRMSLQAIVEVCQHAFHPDGVRLWCRKRGIAMNGKPRWNRLIAKPRNGRDQRPVKHAEQPAAASKGAVQAGDDMQSAFAKAEKAIEEAKKPIVSSKSVTKRAASSKKPKSKTGRKPSKKAAEAQKS